MSVRFYSGECGNISLSCHDLWILGWQPETEPRISHCADCSAILKFDPHSAHTKTHLALIAPPEIVT